MKRQLDSLKVRLLLILLASIAALQVLSYGAVGVSRGYEARHLANEQVAQDLHWLRARLLALPATERAARLPDLRRGSYRLALWAPGQPVTNAPAGDIDALRRAVQQQFGDAGAQVQATTTEGHPALLVPLDAGQTLAVVFDESLPSTRPTAWQVLLYVAVVTLLVAALSVWAVSAITRPLERLTAAGRRLVGDIANATPLEERGPAEVRSLAAGFNTMQGAVQRQLRERTFILAAISHDLKTPLTRLKLRLADLGATVPQAAGIDTDLDAMDALITEGLEYARSTQLRENRMPIDLTTLVESAADQAVDLGQPVQLGPCDAGAVVQGAPRALQRLVQNLVDNALRYGGGAELSVQARGTEIELQVADRGPGIAAEERERMFEPFVRGESSRDRSSGGTGLGLAIARNIAQAHGGRVWLSAREGGGLIAHVALPRAPGRYGFEATLNK